MKIDIITLFPDMFAPLNESIIKRAKEKNLVEINIHNLRKWADDERGTVDDKPYSGGPGMIIKVDIVDRAVESLKQKAKSKKQKVILLDARGEKFTQKKAVSFSKLDHLVLIAGHYEGVDARVADHIADEVISVGDYVLTGGEIPAMIVVDAVARLLPGVLTKESLNEESFSKLGKLEAPQFTRPEEYKGWKVPSVLLSGDPKKIEEWKNKNY